MKKSCVSKVPFTFQMDKRVKDDLVESVLDEKDHRIIRIILTPEGRMNKKISLPRNFPWFLNTDINVTVYYAFTVEFFFK